MTDGTDQGLADAVFSLLEVDASLVTFDGAIPLDATGKPAAQPPYVVVYTSTARWGDHGDNSIDGRSRVITTRFYCHCVGATQKAARAVAQRVRTQLLDKQPVVTGLQCGLLREVPYPPEPVRDESTGSLVIDALVIYELKANN